MDEYIGFIVFIIFGIIALLSKLQEQRRKEDGQPKKQAKDLPEATRRMLYGAPEVRRAREPSGVRTARPRAGAPRPPQQTPVGVPRPLTSGSRQAAEPVPQQRQIPVQRPPAVPQQAARQAPPPPVPMRRQAGAPTARAMRQHPRVQPRVARRPRPAPEGPTDAVARPQPQPPRVVPAGMLQRRKLFANLGAVRQGIILSEILGLPKGLQ